MDLCQLGMGIDFVEIGFAIASGQISSIFDRVICPQHMVFLFQDINFSKSKQISTKLDMCTDIMDIWFGIAMGAFRHILTQLSPHHTIVLSFHIFIENLYEGH